VRAVQPGVWALRLSPDDGQHVGLVRKVYSDRHVDRLDQGHLRDLARGIAARLIELVRRPSNE
jgi:hypothetical protein